MLPTTYGRAPKTGWLGIDNALYFEWLGLRGGRG